MAQPTNKYRTGSMEVAVWPNKGKTKDGKDYTYYSYTIQRGYKDKDGKWQNTASFKVQDLPKAIALLQKAYTDALFDEKTSADEE